MPAAIKGGRGDVHQNFGVHQVLAVLRGCVGILELD